MTPYAHYQYIYPLGSSYELSHVVAILFDKRILVILRLYHYEALYLQTVYVS